MQMIRTFRTSPTRRDTQPTTTTGLRLLSKLLRDLVTVDRFSCYPDLKDAFRRRLLALRIRYQPHEFDDAHTLVGSNLRLIDSAEQPPKVNLTVRETFVPPNPRMEYSFRVVLQSRRHSMAPSTRCCRTHDLFRRHQLPPHARQDAVADKRRAGVQRTRRRRDRQGR